MQNTTANYVKSSKPLVRPLTVLFSTAILAMGGITAYNFWQSSQTVVESNPVTSVPEIKTVTALGRLEPSGEVIQISAPSSNQGDRLEELLVKEGDNVVQGQIMAILDNRDRATAQLKQAEEKVRVAQAKVTQIKAGAKQGEIKAQEATIERLLSELRGAKATDRAKIARLQAQLRGERTEQAAAIELLEAELGNAEREFQRYQQLAQEGAISDSDLDSRRLNLDRAKKRVAEAKAAFSKTIDTLTEEIRETQAKAAETTDTVNQQIQGAKAELDRITEVRPVDVDVAAAEVRQARAEVAQAQVELDLAYIKAPQAGRVLDILTRPGEIVSSDGIARIGQTKQMYAVAEVYESDIGKIHLGQQAQITSNAIAGELQGIVERIGLEVQRQEVINTDPAANIDAKVVEVKVRLDEKSSQKVAGLTNLLVKVVIALSSDPRN
jgi:HlyD family secretion protein